MFKTHFGKYHNGEKVPPRDWNYRRARKQANTWLMKGSIDMKKTRFKKFLTFIALAVIAAVLLTACAGGGTDTGSATTGEKNSSGEAANAAGSANGTEPRVLKVGVSTCPQNISPFTSFTNRQPVQGLLYEFLMDRDVDGNWRGIIAKDWKTDDNIVYDIEIYDYVYDNGGNHITAEDVAFSLIHARDDAANTWIADAEVTGEYTVRLTLSDAQFSTLPTAINRAPIVSKAAFEASEDNMNSVSYSTGPYICTDFVPNVSITFEKNPNYWQKDESLQNVLYRCGTADKLIYTKIAESAQQSIALETGTINVFETLATTEVENFLEGGRNYENFTAIGNPTVTCYMLYFGSKGIGADENFRKACSYAVDKNAIVIGALGGYGTAATFMGAPGGMSDLTPNSASDDYFKYNVELAKDYLSKSSYNGEELTFLIPNEPTHSKIAAIIQSQLLQIGVNCKINSYDNALFQADFATAGAFDLAVCQMGGNDIALTWSFLSANYANFGMGVNDPEFDALIGELMTVEGHNNEVATKVSDYINEHAYGMNTCCTSNYIVYSKDLGALEVPLVSLQSRALVCTVYDN